LFLYRDGASAQDSHYSGSKRERRCRRLFLYRDGVSAQDSHHSGSKRERRCRRLFLYRDGASAQDSHHSGSKRERRCRSPLLPGSGVSPQNSFFRRPQGGACREKRTILHSIAPNVLLYLPFVICVLYCLYIFQRVSCV